MNISLDEQDAVLFVIGVLFTIFITPFLKGYIKKKSENTATKEDIGKITEIVESVRTSIEINKDAYKLYSKERKGMLLDFYDNITSFHFEFLAINFGDFPMDEGKSLFEFQTGFHALVSKILKSYQRLVIYLPVESKLINQANLITNNVQDCRNILKKKFHSIKSSSIFEQQTYNNSRGNDMAEYHSAVDLANIANKEYWDLLNPIVRQLRGHYKIYLTELNTYLQKDKLGSIDKI